ncbi:MAG: hypothetical protein KJ655_01055 [Candidatus Thermoplasmatota archaeon]|nr:hypothetical protein [Candidatus Thermoplasmatota archaeon]
MNELEDTQKIISRMKKIRLVLILFIPYVVILFGIGMYLKPLLISLFSIVLFGCIIMDIFGIMIWNRRIKSIEMGKISIRKSGGEIVLPKSKIVRTIFWLSFALFIGLGLFSQAVINSHMIIGLVSISSSLFFCVIFLILIIRLSINVSSKEKRSLMCLSIGTVLILWAMILLCKLPKDNLFYLIAALVFIPATLIAIIGYCLAMYFAIKKRFATKNK